MPLKLKTAPVNNSVSLEEAKEYLNILDNSDDDLITALIKSAEDQAQSITNNQLEVAEYEYYQDDFSAISLPISPLQSISKVEYFNDSWIEFNSDDYMVDDISTPCNIKFNTNYALSKNSNGVRVTFTCGYLDVPEAFKTWIKIRINTLYENRESISYGNVANLNHNFSDSLLDSYRIRSI